MGSVAKRIKNNVRARRMAQHAELMTPDHISLVGIVGLALADVRTQMLTTYRRFRFAKFGRTSRVKRNHRAKWRHLEQAKRPLPTAHSDLPAALPVRRSFLGRVAEWGRRLIGRGDR